jgi:hypothetical protein
MFWTNMEDILVTILMWTGLVARIGEKRNVYRLLVGKPEGKTPQGRQRHRWKDNIKIDILEIGLSVVNWIGNETSGSIKCWGTTE